MSAHATHATPHDPGPNAADPHGYREALHGLITIGSSFAHLLHGQATAQAVQQPPAQPAAVGSVPATAAQPAPAPAPTTLIALAAAFDGIARTIRRSITLARSLDRPLPPARDPANARTAARKRIIREVEDRIGRADDTDNAHNAADLHAELRDRLDAPDLDDDLAGRPLDDVITEICRDLGLAGAPGRSPWRRRTPADLAHLRARAAAPSPACQPGPGPHEPADTVCPQPDPAGPGSHPPDDPVAAIATILRHPAHVGGQWRPPPDG